MCDSSMYAQREITACQPECLMKGIDRVIDLYSTGTVYHLCYPHYEQNFPVYRSKEKEIKFKKGLFL